MENNKTIIERHTVKIDEGKYSFSVTAAISELDARITNFYKVLDEVKEALTGYAKWAEEVDQRLQKLDPKILLPGDSEFQETVNKLK